jgi:hypothetical protein
MQFSTQMVSVRFLAICFIQSQIERSIHVVRGQRVMIDADLAHLYEVTTAVLIMVSPSSPAILAVGTRLASATSCFEPAVAGGVDGTPFPKRLCSPEKTWKKTRLVCFQASVTPVPRANLDSGCLLFAGAAGASDAMG